MDLKEVQKILEEYLNLSREIQRLVASIDPQRVCQSLLHLRDIYVAFGGSSVQSPKDPLSFWTELIDLETYLPPQEREALRPFKHLVELSLSGLAKGLEDRVVSLIYALMPNPEPRP